MLRNAKDLKNYTLRAHDGDIGRVRDFYFDGLGWGMRYLVVETGEWLGSRQVLISPEAVSAPRWDEEVFCVNLTKEQVKRSPPTDTMRPVFRHQEILLRDYGSTGGIGMAGGGRDGPASSQRPGNDRLYRSRAGR
jgi:hypothetical protein